VNSFEEEYQQQREVLKSVATTLKQASVPFALTGGYAIWARGGPESEHDVDFVVTPDAAEVALTTLLQNGHDPVTSTEDWLDKVGKNGIVVDIIHRLPSGDVDDALLERCDELSVDSVRMPVMAATDLLLNRMLALSDHSCNFSPLLSYSRALREQIDWERIAKETSEQPFARAFLGLLESLEVISHD
jgi:hypothetical protein